jgi:hypothetical protein
MRRLIFCGVLALSGCAREGSFSPDPKIATRQANELMPVGTSEASARKRLTERGFELYRMPSEKAESFLLIATQTRNKQVWQLGVVIVEGRVAGCSANVLPGS